MVAQRRRFPWSGHVPRAHGLELTVCSQKKNRRRQPQAVTFSSKREALGAFGARRRPRPRAKLEAFRARAPSGLAPRAAGLKRRADSTRTCSALPPPSWVTLTQGRSGGRRATSAAVERTARRSIAAMVRLERFIDFPA